eukprot:s82_g23.t1
MEDAAFKKMSIEEIYHIRDKKKDAIQAAIDDIDNASSTVKSIKRKQEKEKKAAEAEEQKRQEAAALQEEDQEDEQQEDDEEEDCEGVDEGDQEEESDEDDGSYRHRETCYLCRAVAYFDQEGEDQTDLLYTNWGRDSAYRSEFLWLQQLKEVFGALSEIALVFAAHGSGLMPPDVNRLVETKYEQYRENYNSGKWYSFFGDLPTLPQFLDKECPGHTGLKDYQVEELPDGSLHFPTSEEAEYPWALCRSYARALRLQLDRDGCFEAMYLAERERHFAEELTRSTSRLGQDVVVGAISSLLARAEISMQAGQEMSHLRAMLRSATYRGTDVRFTADLGTESEPNLHEVPYLAMRWQWKTVLAFPWKTEGHINELELNAFAVFLKRRGRTSAKQHTKFFHVLDSMVSRGALAKGRSSSKRLNRVLRRCGALLVSMDGYCYPLWTISAWNFADRPSRMHETKA